MTEFCYFLSTDEFNCFYYCPNFYEAFKKNISIESVEVVESLEEALLHCKLGMKEHIRKFVFSDTLSDTFLPGSQENFDSVFSIDK